MTQTDDHDPAVCKNAILSEHTVLHESYAKPGLHAQATIHPRKQAIMVIPAHREIADLPSASRAMSQK